MCKYFLLNAFLQYFSTYYLPMMRLVGPRDGFSDQDSFKVIY